MVGCGGITRLLHLIMDLCNGCVCIHSTLGFAVADLPLTYTLIGKYGRENHGAVTQMAAPKT